jgi:hypothetical protein
VAGLGHRDGAERRARALVERENSDPMREAGAPSTGESLACVTKRCARPTGVVMVAPPTLLRNVEGAQNEGRVA